MLTAVATPLRPLRHRLDRARPYALGAAWFFVVFSLGHLAWVISTKWGDPAGLTSLYQATTTTGETVHAWGLGYAGMLGLLVAVGQFALVATAAVMSTVSTPRRRRFGHGVLIGWATLWMLGLMRLAGVDPALDTLAAAGLSTVLFGSTVYRALPRKKTIAEVHLEFAPIDVEPDVEPDVPADRGTRRERAIGAARRLASRARSIASASVRRATPAARAAARAAARKLRDAVAAAPRAENPDFEIRNPQSATPDS
ncbi:MAG: hypothetical protein GY715_11370 [Planctomycetes bacterium]|nr:hypothetical protein [Planctomycetota bacterium]